MKREKRFRVDLAKFYSIILQGDRRLRGKLRLWLFNYGLQCVLLFRMIQAVKGLWGRSRIAAFIPLLVLKALNQLLVFFRHVEIDSKASIGKGFFLMHSSNIYIGPIVIGDNCVIHHNVTIGQRVASGSNDIPRIGANVWIGPGAIITGGITIGDDVTISAGCVISRSVPNHCLVAGNPGRVILRDYDNAPLINYRMSRV